MSRADPEGASPSGTRVSWVRWTLRDIRARWVQVLAIATIVGIGSATYSGLSSTSPWRQVSYDRSFAATAMFDLKVTAAAGTTVDAAALQAVADSLPPSAGVAAATVRLTVPTQIDASGRGTGPGAGTVLVPGALVGIDTEVGGGGVSTLSRRSGRGLTPADDGKLVGVLDQHFAHAYELPTPTRLSVSGDRQIEIVGTALHPEYLLVLGPGGGFLGEANYGVVFASLRSVQDLADRPGQAGELLVRLTPGTDRSATARLLRAATRQAFPDLAFDLINRDQERSYQLLYDDISGDQRLFNIFAVIILAGAAFAAFNLTTRMVEAQRREIGIGMALGLTRRRLALRPMMVGAEVALIGVVAGAGIGWLITRALRSLYIDLFPLPVWRTDFQPAVFARGALLGFLLPLVACLVPVVRAVRVSPIDAIRTSHRTPSGGLAPLLARVRRRGSTLGRLPFRNVLRTPRRTLLTAAGIGAAICVLVGVMGLIDSVLGTVDRGERSLITPTPDRVIVDLDFFTLTSGPEVRAVSGNPTVGDAESGLYLPGKLGSAGTRFDVLVNVIQFDSDIWRPHLEEGRLDDSGIAISRRAAQDLGVGVGDSVSLRHPVRQGLTGYRYEVSDLPVVALHDDPYRFQTYVDVSRAEMFNLSGIANTLQVRPAAGSTSEDVQRALFPLPSVASVQPVARIAEVLRTRLAEIIGIFAIVQGVVVLLTLLIAVNSSSISLDERRREHATMFALGLPTSRVVVMSMIESLVTGTLGTLMGLVAGRLLLLVLVHRFIPETFPELGIDEVLRPGTVILAVVAGVVVVALAPVLNLRRLRSMDIPSQLRVVE